MSKKVDGSRMTSRITLISTGLRAAQGHLSCGFDEGGKCSVDAFFTRSYKDVHVSRMLKKSSERYKVV